MSAVSLRKLFGSGARALSSSSTAICHFPNALAPSFRFAPMKQGQLLRLVRGMGDLELKKLLLVEDKVSASALDALSAEQLEKLFKDLEQKYSIAALCDFVIARTQPLPHESISPLLDVVRSQRSRTVDDFATLFRCNGFLAKVPLDISHINQILESLVEARQAADAFRVLCFAEQTFGPAVCLNGATLSLLVPTLARSDSWEPVFYLLSRLRGAGAPSLPVYEVLLRECAEKPLVRWVYAKQFLYDILASTENNVAHNSIAVKRAAVLALNTLLAASRSGEVVLFFQQWGRSEAARELLLDEELLRIKAFAAAIRSSPHSTDPSVAAAGRVALIDVLQILSRCSFGGSDHAVAAPRDVCAYAMSAIRTNARLLHTKAVLVFAAVSAVLVNLEGDGAQEMAELHQMWTQLSDRLQQSPPSSSDDARLFEVLALLSELSLSSELDASAAHLITAFLRTLLRVIDDGAADLLASGPRGVIMTPRLGDLLIEAFGATRDGEGVTLTLLRCEEQDVLLSDKSFNIAGTLVNEAGDHKLLIGLFELRAKRIVRSLQRRQGAGAGAALQAGGAQRARYSLDKSSHVFVPVLKAFARMNDVESMLQLVMVDMREDLGIAPRCSLIVTLIDALLAGGRAAEAAEIVKRNLANAGAADGATIYHPIVEALADVSLRAAAETRDGELALQVFSQAVVDSSRDTVGDSKSAELRMAELACLSLGSRETVHMIPMLLSSLMQAQDLPLLLSDGVLASVLSVAVACQSHEVFAYGLGLSNKNRNIRIDPGALGTRLREVCIDKYGLSREQVMAFLQEFDAKSDGALLREHAVDRKSLNL